MSKKTQVAIGQIWYSKYNNAYCVVTAIKEVVDVDKLFQYACIKWTDTLEDDEVATSVLLGQDKFDYEHFTLII
jgi:hypothetical protein